MLAAAAAAYQEALVIRQEIGQGALAVDDLAGLARIALKQDRTSEALAHTQEMLGWIDEHGVEGIEYPVSVYLTAAETYTAVGQGDRVAEVITAAQAWLAERAARISDEPEPHLPTEEAQDAMGLESFFDKHCNVGDPCPSETLRMVGLRRKALDGARERQAGRKARIEQANATLAAEIQAIVEADA